MEITPERHAEYIKNNLPRIYVGLSDYCSNRCWYCFAGTPWKYPETAFIDKIGAQKYVDECLSMAGNNKVEYCIGSGEPLENEHFYKIVFNFLNVGHHVRLFTNGLKMTNIYPFPINIYRKQFKINLSYHLGAQSIKDISHAVKYAAKFFGEILPRALEISNELRIIVPMVPPLFEDLPIIVELFQCIINIANSYGKQIIIVANEFYGMYQGKQYPQSYTSMQRMQLSGLKSSFEDNNFTLADINVMCDAGRVLYLRGMLCYYASRVKVIRTDGKVSICGSGTPEILQDFGDKKNIFDGNKKPLPCPFDKCNCITKGYEGCLKPHGLSYSDYPKLNQEAI